MCYNEPINFREAVRCCRFWSIAHLSLIITGLVTIPTYMQEGIIAGITDKGFGFIKYEGGAKDLFFHSNELIDVSFDDLRQGDKVTFEMADGPKGPYASSVRKA